MRSPRHYCKLSDFFFFFFVRQINDDDDDDDDGRRPIFLFLVFWPFAAHMGLFGNLNSDDGNANENVT